MTNESVSKTKKAVLKEDDFPTDATWENIENLIQKGQTIENMKPKWVKETIGSIEFLGFYLSLIVIFLAFILFLFGINFLWVAWSLKTLPAEFSKQILLFGLSFAIGMFVLIVGIYIKNPSWMLLVYKVFKFPRPEFEVFGWLSAIAECFIKGNRKKIPNLLSNLREASDRYLDVNGRLRRSLSPDINTLMQRPSLQDLILFTDEKEMPILFLNIGLALIHDNFPRVHNLIGQFQ